MSFCNKCGAQMSGDEPFCGQCGSPRKESAPVMQAQAAKKRKVPVIAVIVALFVIAGAAGAYFIVKAMAEPQPMFMVADIDEKMDLGDVRYGFADREGNEIASRVYELAYDNTGLAGTIDEAWSSFQEGFALVQKEADGKIGYIGENGQMITSFAYDRVGYFFEGLALVGRENADSEDEGDYKYGFIDKEGNEVVPLIYDEIKYSADDKGNRTYFVEGLAMVAKENLDSEDEGDYKYGYIDKEGNEVIPLNYNSAMMNFSEGLAAVGKKNADGDYRWGYIDKEGNEVIPLMYDSAESFSEGLAIVGRENVDTKDIKGDYKLGYIDKEGHEVIPLMYDSASSFSEGLAAVGRENADGERKSGYIDKEGNEVVPLIYEDAGSFSEGLALVYRENADGEWKQGYIDKEGNEVIPLIYDSVLDFSEGLAAVIKVNADGERKWGYIDKEGNEVIPLNYDSAQSFSEGLAIVAKKDADGEAWIGCIDKEGNEVPPSVDANVIVYCKDGIVPVRQNGRVGVMNSAGKVKWADE